MNSKSTSSSQTAGFSFRDYELLASSMRKWSPQKTVKTAIYAALAAILDVCALVALVPLVTIAMGGRASMVTRHVTHLLGVLGLTSPSGRLAGAIGIFLVVMASRSWATLLRERAVLGLQTGYSAYLQKAVMNALARASWREIESLRHARITQALGADVLRAASSAQQLMQILGAVLVLVLQWCLALVIAPAIAVAMVVIFAVGGLAFGRSLLRTGAIGVAINERNLSMVHIAQQFLGGLKLAKAQNSEVSFTAEFGRLTEEMMDLRYGYQSRQIRMRQGLTFAAAASAGLLLVVGHWAGFDAAQLFAAFAVLTRISAAATMLVNLLQQLSSAIPSNSYLVRLIAELESYSSSGSSERASLPPLRLEPVGANGELIRLDRVTYRSGTVDRVQDISLAILPGEVVALSGDSGAGKSTTVDILAGLLLPSAGRVLVHGVLLDDAVGQAWRDRLAYVTQETWLINDTIRTNLTWGREAVPDEELWWALTIAGANALVTSCEHGLETQVNERGSRFSGGERQRLALARAVLRRPEMLILDEATNAIDPEAERGIFSRLLTAMPMLSMIIIAHRPSTLALCSRTIVMQEGRIVSVTHRN